MNASGFVGVPLALMVVLAVVVGLLAPPPVAAVGTQPAAVGVARSKPQASITARRTPATGGQVLVQVWSNAKKVKLSYRVGARSRAATVKLRGGTASRLLPVGTSTVYAQAKATSRLRASVRTPATEPATASPPATGGATTQPPASQPQPNQPAVPASPPVVTPPADTTAPGPVTGLRVTTLTDRTVGLAGNNPGDIDLAVVTVRRAAGTTPPTAPTQGTSVTVSGATAADTASSNTTYSYAVFTTDTAGNTSTPAALTITTLPTPVGEGANNLPTGYSLESATTMHSPDGRYLLRNQADGNLVEYVADSNRAIWSTNTAGAGPARLVMQTDGNLVLYSLATKRPLWSSGTAGISGPRFDVQNDSNLVVYDRAGARWASSTTNDQLAPREWLHPGQAIVSRNGRYRLIQQGDGNLVVYDNSTAIWSTATMGADRVTVMQEDGNLVTYAPGTVPVWSSRTTGHPGATTVMQDDGNLVIYQGGTALWASRQADPGPSGDDYPAAWRNAAQDSVFDTWRYYNRECTSFVAFRVATRNAVPGYGDGFPHAIGNAVDWAGWARNHGYTVDNSPRVGSVAWWGNGYGHVAWVRAVSGGNVTIEEYNYDYNGHYNTRTISASSVSSFIHFHDLN